MSIHEQMIKIMREVEAIGKDQTNETQKFKFRGIDDVYNSLHETMAKHGVYNTAKVLTRDRSERQTRSGGVLAFTTLQMEYTFWAEDGSSVTTQAQGEGMDSGDKGSNKAMAVAHKYALLQAFMIPTADMKDADGYSYELNPVSYTEEEKRLYNAWLESGDAFGFHIFNQSLSLDAKKDLFNDFPKGEKTKKKEQVRKAEAEGVEITNAYLERIHEGLEEEDLVGIEELFNELDDGEKQFIWKLVPRADKDKFHSLKKEVAA